MNFIKKKNTDKNKGLVNVIESGLVHLAEDEIENKRLYDIVNTVENIL